MVFATASAAGFPPRIRIAAAMDACSVSLLRVSARDWCDSVPSKVEYAVISDRVTLVLFVMGPWASSRTIAMQDVLSGGFSLME